MAWNCIIISVYIEVRMLREALVFSLGAVWVPYKMFVRLLLENWDLENVMQTLEPVCPNRYFQPSWRYKQLLQPGDNRSASSAWKLSITGGE